MDALRAIIAERAELSEERIDATRHGVAKDLALLETEARGLFDAAREREAMLEPLYEDLKASEDALQDLSGKWATQLSEAERGLLQRSRQIDMEQSRLNDLKSTLIASLLSVQ